MAPGDGVRTVHAVLRFVLAVLFAIVVVPMCLDTLLRTIEPRRHVPEDPLWMAAGLMLGVVLIFVKRPNWLLHTMIHEACHFLACLLLGVKVHKVMASDGRGGEVEHQSTGPLRTVLIALAPYTIPLVLGPILLWRHVAPEGPLRSALSLLTSIAYITHLTGLIHNVRLNLRDPKGDLAKVGRLLALTIILGMLMLVTALTIVVLWG